ncbi:hypothetical protein [Flavobacterium psychrophilum]|uniref:Peptide chain release factor 1 n=1 Tax=Flavobacterium psychrophilum TaxID=96345 RepID=A0A8G2G2S4_FLAPS|nr:hypothetical protein [Flavobacterium psychrophilum]EKT4553246.1 hypothetical protein [Flavobacterium psychrophilum]MBF2093085.1 hypothetical protein [Flavobacterium psychrophilum]MCB6089534.1 hypothetical protein [Flavobacterium psychrophilum]MCB6232287.1 hypothetical protein [Flavobacterium psychrophilum]OJH13722.1 hypothetical protein FPG87_12840 [Flavobacterium psychrophilum]
MNIEILDNLIAEGETLTQTISYVPAGHNVIRTYSVYTTPDKEKYQNWQSSVLRFVRTYHSSDLEEVKKVSEKLSPENHRKILGILKAIKLLPNEPEKPNENKVSTNNININNTQSVSQQLTLNIFLDAIKDELTGKDFKALKEIMKDYEKEPDKTKGKIIEKIKGFGGDVLSNIVANILTNPTIYSGIF